MPKTRQQKEDFVAELTDKLNKAKSVVLADYQGLTMSQLTELRQKLEDIDAEFTVTKNNLLEIALKQAGYDANPESFAGPVATLMAYSDEVSPIKTLTKAIKDYQVGKVKTGFLNKEELSAARVDQLSQLPSKDELRGKTVGVLVAPLHGMLNVLQGNLRNLVYVLDQIRVKGGES